MGSSETNRGTPPVAKKGRGEVIVQGLSEKSYYREVMYYIYSLFIPVIQTILLLYTYLNGFTVKLLKRKNTLINIKKSMN
jgi:hypothetical protein